MIVLVSVSINSGLDSGQTHRDLFGSRTVEKTSESWVNLDTPGELTTLPRSVSRIRTCMVIVVVVVVNVSGGEIA